MIEISKENKYKNDIISGVLPIFKESGMTSHDAVAKIRKLYETKRVGHTGTLDPMATGVLVVLIGRAAKAAEYVEKGTKQYKAVLRLGITTDTGDITGKVLSESAVPQDIDIHKIENDFSGEIKQKPPMYSAIKIGGRKMVDLARQGITVDIPERNVQIYSLKIEKTKIKEEYAVDVVCSCGTYIRTLCSDIGNSLGCGGTMSSLCRTRNSGFTEKDCLKIEELEKTPYDERKKLLIDTEQLFSSIPKVSLNSFFAKLAKDGNCIYQKKAGYNFTSGTRVRLCDEHGFFSLGEVMEQNGESVIKPIKKFRIED
ncbi:MAG: tRNA pseudouridine(55) synthase TruB [Clostridia bacterium]|nr:tRNA pseudouridine(55) synthase TruB [Clostridia bacterium]